MKNKLLKIDWEDRVMEVVDSLYESMEYDFENGADIIDSLRRINKVPKKDWVKVLEGFKEWELRLLYRDWETDRKSTRLNSSH